MSPREPGDQKVGPVMK